MDLVIKSLWYRLCIVLSPSITENVYPTELNRFIKKDLAKHAKKNLISGEVDEAWIEREKWDAERLEKVLLNQ